KGAELKDIAWYLPEGSEMSGENWSHDFAKSLAIFMDGQGIRPPGPSGERTVDNSFYIMFNAHYEPIEFILPTKEHGTKWIKVLDTHHNISIDQGEIYKARQKVLVESRSIVIMKEP